MGKAGAKADHEVRLLQYDPCMRAPFDAAEAHVERVAVADEGQRGTRGHDRNAYGVYQLAKFLARAALADPLPKDEDRALGRSKKVEYLRDRLIEGLPEGRWRRDEGLERRRIDDFARLHVKRDVQP